MTIHKIQTTHHADIIIVGAGIAGYEAFRTLSRQLKRYGIKKTITLIDQNNFFTFVPLLHEVASGAVEPTHASVPIRELIHNTPHTFIRARMTRIDPEEKIVSTTAGNITFETCVIATGSTTNYFNTPGAKEHTYHVRTLRDALTLQSALLSKLESCSVCPIDITIVGGGYTGVELAAEFAQLTNHELKQLYPTGKASVTIIDPNETILSLLPKKVQTKITAHLTHMGVTIINNERVTAVSSETLTLASGKTLPNSITIWSTGFTSDAGSFLPESCVEKGRVATNQYLQTKQYPSIYALGDVARIVDPTNPEVVYPQLGEAAHKAGEYVGTHIVRTLLGKTTKPFHFKSHATLMPIGEWYGVAIFSPRIIFFGKLAWWMRRTAYVLFMPGFLRKLRIILDWTLMSFGFRHIIDLQIEEEHVDKT